MCTELNYEQIHTFCTNEDGDDEDQHNKDQKEEPNAIPDPPKLMEHHNGNIEKVINFYQKCVICLDNPDIYAFRLCGRQCNCEHCYQNESDVDLLKCVICRT